MLSGDAPTQRIASNPGRGGCGVGAVADLTGRPSHDLLDLAISGLRCLEHRGGTLDGTGDGAGLLLTTDRAFFARFLAPGRHLPDGHHLSDGVVPVSLLRGGRERGRGHDREPRHRAR